MAAPYTRTEGNNIHNMGAISLDTQWTRLLGTELSYQNNFYDYPEQRGQLSSSPSLAGLLNRLEHDIALNVNWRLQPTLLAFVGYQYEQINYTGNEPIGFNFLGTVIYSDNRDNRSQYGYVGAQYTPLDNLNLAAQAGIQYADYYNPASRVLPQPINFLLMQNYRELIPICREVMCK